MHPGWGGGGTTAGKTGGLLLPKLQAGGVSAGGGRGAGAPQVKPRLCAAGPLRGQIKSGAQQRPRAAPGSPLPLPGVLKMARMVGGSPFFFLFFFFFSFSCFFSYFSLFHFRYFFLIFSPFSYFFFIIISFFSFSLFFLLFKKNFGLHPSLSLPLSLSLIACLAQRGATTRKSRFSGGEAGRASRPGGTAGPGREAACITLPALNAALFCCPPQPPRSAGSAGSRAPLAGWRRRSGQRLVFYGGDALGSLGGGGGKPNFL